MDVYSVDRSNRYIAFAKIYRLIPIWKEPSHSHLQTAVSQDKELPPHSCLQTAVSWGKKCLTTA